MSEIQIRREHADDIGSFLISGSGTAVYAAIAPSDKQIGSCASAPNLAWISLRPVGEQAPLWRQKRGEALFFGDFSHCQAPSPSTVTPSTSMSHVGSVPVPEAVNTIRPDAIWSYETFVIVRPRVGDTRRNRGSPDSEKVQMRPSPASQTARSPAQFMAKPSAPPTPPASCLKPATFEIDPSGRMAVRQVASPQVIAT